MISKLYIEFLIDHFFAAFGAFERKFNPKEPESLVSDFFSDVLVEDAASEFVCAFCPPLVNPKLSGFLG